jgi:hypothetical protein
MAREISNNSAKDFPTSEIFLPTQLSKELIEMLAVEFEAMSS